ncbi:hypothetical protein VOLCADRAFT_104568 [Volvox carteri f. nagariensis]|uniref:Uncharacterized protein n=1 Tax=Volvox carteri f. nagariensis TaxID=3068 RepID=D8TUH6_VOLCA|nr:uncharacterized protein VOLCADRAFT_104568 [Volvox carteri f. nagariensis]EFJ48709.1 hypothetical protein VOLCADRAFT_104568 [Volvox carteri f. nagariensis]|eukprot:XP_002950041.1 hypothetical protein VOLCADRAFT_104568 [Volvox carteri f. nagariensis]
MNTEVATSAVRLVIVNDVAGHFEVLAGILARLYTLMQKQQRQQLQQQQPSAHTTDLWIEPQPRVLYTGNARAPVDNGLNDWLGKEVVGAFSWHPLTASTAITDIAQPPPPPPGPGWRTPADVIICVSAELAPKVCRNVLMAVQPRLLVVVVHRADTHTPNARILFLHPTFELMALAPHVANLSRHMLKRSVDWSMPVAAFTPRKPCRAKKCLRGFSIQGALRRFKSRHGNGFTRDYVGLWQRLMQLRATGQAVPPVVVMGKGQREDLLLPPELDDRVAFYPWLKYPDFWSLIHHSYALVPAFGMPVYYESRISSTILASLLTCVPVIAEQRLLDTYTFLEERHVFLRQPGEDEAAAMVRIMGLPEEEVFSRRDALCALQQQMNERADATLTRYLSQALRDDGGGFRGFPYAWASWPLGGLVGRLGGKAPR